MLQDHKGQLDSDAGTSYANTKRKSFPTFLQEYSYIWAFIGHGRTKHGTLPLPGKKKNHFGLCCQMGYKEQQQKKKKEHEQAS